MKISVCTLTARRGYIDAQAYMLSKQTYSDLEWVLVDFAYEENAMQIQKLSKKLGLKIKHVPNVRDGKLFFRDITRNRNKALALADGDAVIFLDDYAVIPDNFVAEHVDMLEKGFISAGLMHRLEETLTDEELYYTPENDINKYPNSDEYLMDRYVLKLGKDFRDKNGTPYNATGITYTGNLGIPRKVFEELNGFDPRMESGLEDCDLGMRAHMAYFKTVFNPFAYTLNLCTGNRPYVYHYDHVHDVEPFISNANNKYKGDSTLPENEFMKVEFHENYRIAICKICGARGMIDPNELIAYKYKVKEMRVPNGLDGGFDTLSKSIKK